MASDLKGCIDLGKIDQEKAVFFKHVDLGVYSLRIRNFESDCEIVLDESEVKNLITKMVNEL